MDKYAVLEHLQERKQQLHALILYLQSSGETHSQYDQLAKCKAEYELVISQLQRLQKQNKKQGQPTAKL
ncbi:MAG: hypothetical protein JGK10_16315 [Microcoleus sp. PH2017_13_LAR_U_A]|uniref:hypothetical protein n=1 Tax=unclassified Microcoleus TaxID=2642155 RepID=UPI001DA7294F|nr:MULTISPECIES: hypothetical protein [unclassified Microcoleus]MCC3473312.1 hypothetical protein [Microcoleus sp. PH2017_13_LAR_U_A]MCC3623164.1 hypothetical protein [Microcoleus sp. PH2017_36_ELK_O_B]